MKPIVLFALSVLLACPALAQSPRSDLMLGHAVEQYFPAVYAAKSRTGFVFFAGEPIAYRVSVGNIGAARTSLVAGSTNSQQLFQVETFFSSISSPETAPGSRYKYADERAVNIPVVFSNPNKRWAGGRFDINFERETPLDPREALEWVLSVPSNSLEPGRYRFVIRVNASDSAQRRLDGFTSFAFEVRPTSAENQPEILVREVRRRILGNDREGARAAAADLLRVHPNSYMAYSLLTTIADNEAQRTQHSESAQAILRGGRDELLIKYMPKEELKQLLGPLGRLIE